MNTAEAPSPAAAPAPDGEAKGASATEPVVHDPKLDLPPVERKRLEYALASAKLFARDWPWMNADEACVLLIAPTVQWIVNCKNPPSKAVAVGAPLNGRPVYANASETISMGGRSVPASAVIQAVPATADVNLPGTAGESPWVIVSALDALIEIHPAFDEKTTTEEWLSIFLHEFFHTRQMMLPSFRPALADLKARKLDPDALEKAYTTDATYKALVEREHVLLAEAAAKEAALTSQGAREVLGQWRALYEERRVHLSRLGGEALQRADVVATYVEGTARYAEAHFLSDPRLHATLSLEGDPHFGEFRSWPSGYAGLSQRGLMPRYFYTFGMHLGLLLDRAEPGWKARVSEHPDWIVGLVGAVATKGSAAATRPLESAH